MSSPDKALETFLMQSHCFPFFIWAACVFQRAHLIDTFDIQASICLIFFLHSYITLIPFSSVYFFDLLSIKRRTQICRFSHCALVDLKHISLTIAYEFSGMLDQIISVAGHSWHIHRHCFSMTHL